MTHHNAAGLVPGNTNNASTSLHSNDTIGIVQQGLDVYIELLCAAAGIAGGANSQGMKVAKLSVVSVFVGYVWARKACMSEIYTGVCIYDIIHVNNPFWRCYFTGTAASRCLAHF